MWADLLLWRAHTVAHITQTRENALKPGATGFDVYSVSKSLSNFAGRNSKWDHPALDVASIYPSYIFGPLSPGQVYSTPAAVHLWAHRWCPRHPVRGYAIELVSKKRPELKERLPVITGKELPGGLYSWPYSTLDISKTKSLLGMKNYVKWQDTVLDTRGRPTASRRRSQASHVKCATIGRGKEASQVEEITIAGRPRGFSTSVSVLVLFRVHVGESGDLAEID